MEEETKNQETQEEIISEETTPQETAVEEETGKDESGEEKPLEKMTAPELKDIAKDIPGVTGVTAKKKDELIALIKEYRGIEDNDSDKKDVVKGGLTVKEIKEKIAALKAVRKDARNDKKNRKLMNAYRRRINRLKKRTRKPV
jgi:hypothetical protein